MNRVRSITQSLLRWTASGLSFSLALAILFLGGYWAGWKTEPKGGIFTKSNRPSSSVASLPQHQRATAEMPEDAPAPDPAAVAEVAESVEDRVVRLAKWLATGRDTRAGSARVTTEIAGMYLTEAWDALEQLHQAPNTMAVAQLRSLLLLRWAAVDPARAFEYWRGSLKSLRWPESLNYQFLDRWAKVDAVAALNGWKTLVTEKSIPEHNQGFPLRRIFARLAAQDFSLASQQAMQIEGAHQEEALRGMAELAFHSEQREQLLNELSSWPSGEARSQAVAAAVANWANAGQLDQAMSWLDESGLDEATRFSIVKDIGMRRFHDHYQEGADWLLAQTRTPEQRSRVLADLIVNWMQYDIVEAGRWLVAQGLDESASRAMQVYAGKLTTDFPEEAMLWALTIPDEARRQAALRHVEERLRERHPHRAEELLQRWSSQAIPRNRLQ